MVETRDLIARVASLQTVVFISGETGTGKEVVARQIHMQSAVKDGPFIALNCSALSESLIESELFGHEKGAFTGATERRPGKLEQAAGGTLFLDEFGEMPLKLQPKLLRVLDGHPFERVGGKEAIKPKFRLIVATNANIEQMVRDKTFRADLYFRVFTYPIHLTPLRERRDDIPALANHFLELERAIMLAGGLNNRPLSESFSEGAMIKLRRLPWDGNVRELRNVVTRALIYSTEPEIPASAIIESGLSSTVGAPPTDEEQEENLVRQAVAIARSAREGTWLDGQQAEVLLVGAYLQSALDRYGTQSAAASAVGISRSTFRKKLAVYRELVGGPQLGEE